MVLALIWSSENARPFVLGGVVQAAVLTLWTGHLMKQNSWRCLGTAELRNDMKMSDIKIPDDHGLFYVNPKNLIYADWLLNAVARADERKDFNGSLDCLIRLWLTSHRKNLLVD